MFYKVPKIWCTVQHNLTLRQRWRHMRHHYQVLIHIESWYEMVVWPGMQLAIPLYVKMSDSVPLNRAVLQFSIILIHLYTGSSAEYTQNASNTQYNISQWPLNRFEWIMAWIVGMDCAQPQIRHCRIWLCSNSFDCNCTSYVEYTKNTSYLHDQWTDLNE